MAELTKFNERNVAIFSTIEATAGVYVAPATTDATPATTMTGAVTYETNAFKFLGDNLSRDEYTYVKDLYADISIETFQQVLGSLNASLAVNSAPLSELYQACGGHVTVLGSIWNGLAAGSVIIDNVNASNTTISVDYRKTSIQDAVNQKLWKFNYIRGMLDVSANVGEVPTNKFALKGNAQIPVISPILSANFGTQVGQVAAPVRKQNVVSCIIAPAILITSITFSTTTATVNAANHGLVTGNSVEITGVAISGSDDLKYNGVFTVTVVDANTFTYTMSAAPSANATGTPVGANLTLAQNFNFGTLAAANFLGFDLTRYLTSLEEGFGKDATPTDVTIGMLENQSASFAVSVVSTTTTATATVPTGHGLIIGSSVTILTGNANYDGTWIVATSAANTITYTIPSYTNATPALGTGTNNSVTYFDPDSNMSKFFSVKLKFGTGVGKYITYKWNKLQLANVKDGKVANLFSRECTFRNTGKSYIIME